MTAAKRKLRCSSATSNTVSRAELGNDPLETTGDMRKLEWQYKLRNMTKNRLPARVDRAVWEKVTKGRAGIRWDSVVEKVWKNKEGNQKEVVSAGKYGRYKAEVEDRMEKRERLALRNKVESEKKHSRDIWGTEGRNRNERVHGPMEFAKPLKLCFRAGDLGLREGRKRYNQ